MFPYERVQIKEPRKEEIYFGITQPPTECDDPSSLVHILIFLVNQNDSRYTRSNGEGLVKVCCVQGKIPVN